MYRSHVHPKSVDHEFTYTRSELNLSGGERADIGGDLAFQKAREISNWIGRTLDRSLWAIVAMGVPMDQLWLDHQGSMTRIMRGPYGMEHGNDSGLKIEMARVWTETVLRDGSGPSITMHYQGPDIGSDS